jgi:hypothetical protein
MFKSTFARLLALRSTMIAALVVLVGGGVALATTATSSNGPSATPGHTPAPHGTYAPKTHGPKSHEPGSAKDKEAKTHGTPSPSLHGLCHAVQAGATSNPGKAIDNPAFSVLVAAAGGKDNLASYCAKLIGPRASHRDGKPDDQSPAHHPTGPPDHARGPHKSHPMPHHATPNHPGGRP